MEQYRPAKGRPGFFAGQCHTDEAKARIGAGAKGKGRGGFNLKINCPNCAQEMSPANLGRHLPSCNELVKHWHLFPDIKTIKALAHRQRIMIQQYGLDFEAYEKILKEQQGLCAICSQLPPENSKLHIDHCHDTGKVRALLCRVCNVGLGHFGESVERLQAAIDYLQSHNADPHKD
jgi:hypothetical protein